MNHLGDTNKMVSETPRTQAVWELFATDTTLEPDVEFSTLARQLERELNAANDRIKRLIRERDEARAERDEAAKVVEKALSELGQVARSRCALIDRIKRLEEAGDAMFPWSERVGQEFWTKAKEAKL
jgi:chromosome segregation ATPase